MRVRFIQPMAGTNPDGTALFIEANQELDLPQAAAELYVERGIAVALEGSESSSEAKPSKKAKPSKSETGE